MKMVGWVGVIAVCSVLVGLTGWRQIRLADSAPSIVVNGLLAQREWQRLFNFVTSLHKRLLDPADFFAYVNQEFPFIKSGSVSTYRVGHAHYCFILSKPCGVINDRFVLFDNGLLSDKNLFEPPFYGRLAVVSAQKEIIQNRRAMAAIARYLSQVPEHIMQSHQLVFFQNGNMYVRDKFDPYFSIRFDYSCALDDHVIAMCNRVKQSVMQQEQQSSKRRTGAHRQVLGSSQWTADIRFKDQIVVYRERGGTYHG